MLEQVTWMPGPAAPIEVVARGGCREALGAGSNRYRDHVFLQPLVVADSRITPRCQHIDEAILGDYLESYLRIRGEEAWNDRGQHQACGAHGDIEAQGPPRPGTKPIPHIGGSLPLFKRGPEPLQQTLTRLSGNDTACGAMEQSHTE